MTPAASTMRLLKSFGAGHWYREILRVSLPLIVTTSTTMVMEITDRIFLSHHSLDAIAAATPGGLAALLFMSVFIGTGSYVNVFIAQYTGAGSEDRIGSALWQGVYFAAVSVLLLILIGWLVPPLFHMTGHAPEVARLEAVYFRILCFGGGISVLGTVLSCFYSGRGLTRPVMLVHLAGAVVNIPLNYALINGLWIFPELGIAGAGIATVAAWVTIAVLFRFMIFNAENDRRFGVWKNRALDRRGFRRLITYGVPGALQFTMDLLAFTIFVFMVGRLGTTELAVTNIVLSINSLAFMPMMGTSIGISTLVGQALGRNRPDQAEQITRETLHLIFLYIFCMAFLFLGLPEQVLGVFRPGNVSPAEYAAIEATGVVLLRFVTFYIFFDAQYMVYVGALKGAGDTRFIMGRIAVLALTVMGLPLYAGVTWFRADIYFAWFCVTMFILSLFLTSWRRYRSGVWKNMRVIGEAG